jgi:hypothetical protein
MSFNNLRYVTGIYRPPAAGFQEELFSFETLRCDQVDGAKPSVPPDLGRFLEDRADRVMINPASAEKAEADHDRFS